LVTTWHFLFLLSSSIRDSSFGILDWPLELRYAITTFLAGDPEYYFIAARIITYQLLYANETRCHDFSITFLVLVISTVSEVTRRQLALDGATVVPVEDIPLRWWIKTGCHVMG
jgi:hypothetical protein